ncbi:MULTISPECIES: hypothetical protein [Bacillus cereus group]|uniref:DUF4025 domain-containing protein n=1 Tax=Bacillus proteolyticus TaxID=2026192 RepID=A0ABV3IAI4_9BACI|nr:hypothetical protein [Bacillus cereus group sp. N8]MBJ8105975.1 hypothetical protein [Bacillus cereus group sp. N8]
MKYDEINEYYRKQAEQKAIEKTEETPEDGERKKQEDHQKLMENIYGEEMIKNGELNMNKGTLGE